MKLPKKLKVGYHTFPVTTVSDRVMSVIANPNTLGFFSGKDGIKIVNNLEREHTAHTLLHEVLHAACYYRETYRDPTANAHQEFFVNEINSGLCTIIAQNPQLFKDIIKELT